MEVSERQQKHIVMFAILFNNVMYILVAYILIVLGFEGSLSDYSQELPIFFGGVILCLVPSIFYAIKVVKENIPRTEMIIRLALYHIPSLLGFGYLLISAAIK